MYCMNCGKEISGNIPICGECLQSVLDKHRAEQDILTRVNLEAQTFSIKEVVEDPIVEEAHIESEPETLLEDNDISSEEFHSPPPSNTQNTNDDSDKGAIIAAAIFAGIIAISLVFAAIKMSYES